MIEKRSYFSRALVILMALMLVFTMMPSSMWSTTAYAETTVEWAGAANSNAQNNNVKSTLTSPLNDYNTTYEKWKTQVATGTGGAYAGQTAIVGDYIYITSEKGLQKINKETGVVEATNGTLAGVGSSAYCYDYMVYDATSGLLFVCDTTFASATDYVGTQSIRAVDLSTFKKVGELTGLSLGTYHPLQCNGNYLFSNGHVFKFEKGEGSCTITEYDTLDGSYNWSSGCFASATSGTYSGKTIFYVASTTALIAYCPETKTVIDTWTFTNETVGDTTIPAASYSAGVSYDNGRLYFGYYNYTSGSGLTNGYMFSIKVNDEETFDKTSDGSKIVKDSAQPTLCTPVISGGRVYVAGQSGAVSVYDAKTLELKYTAEANDLYNASAWNNNYKGGITKIQSNPVAYHDDTNSKTYLYFQTYNVPGYIYMLEASDTAESGSLKRLATPSEGQATDTSGGFAMEQIAIDNAGNIYCYNELGYLFCFVKNEASLTSLKAKVGETDYYFTKAFDSQLQNYTLYVPKDTTKVNFEFTTSEGASVTVNSSSATGSYEFSTDSENRTDTATIAVTKNASTRTYVVTVRRVDKDVKYVMTDGDTAPADATSSTLLTEKSNAVVDVTSTSTSKPCFWITAPDSGSITCEQIDGDNKATIADETGTFAKKVYFSEGTTGQNVVRVTTTAEDGTTQKYNLVVSQTGEYIAVDKVVSVTISDKGKIVTGNDENKTQIANVEVTAKDLNNDCTVDVDEVLQVVHNTYYGGTKAEEDTACGYKSGTTSYGLSLQKLWGDTSTYFGYYIGNSSCWSLADTLSDGDYLKAFIYKDQPNCTDANSYFNSNEYTAKPGQSLSLKLTKVENWGASVSDWAGATVKILNANSTKDYTTDEDGKVTLTFDSKGTYKVIAVAADGKVIPSVCKVVVSNESSTTPTVPADSTVTFTLMGDTNHDDSLVHTLRNGGLTTWISTRVQISTGDTVETVFKKVLGSKTGYSYKGLAQNYISEITKDGETLGEKDNGANSGWMYTVNGTHPLACVNDYVLSSGDVIVFHYTDDYTKEEGSDKWSGAAATDTQTVTTTGTTGAATTTSPADVKVTEQTGTDGSKEKVAEVTVSAANQKEILSQAKTNKSAEIVLNASSDSAKDASKVNVKLDKSFVNSIVSDTDAKLTVKTPLGDKTYTQDELKTLAAAATGTTVTLTIEKADSQADTEDELNVKAEVAKLTPVARSSKTAKKYIKVTTSLDKSDKAIITELKDAGYTVKYRFYRSTKKASSYQAKLTGTTGKYTNTAGKKGTRYYYKVQLRVYDKDGNFVAKTAIKQCKYATRIFGK